MIETDARREAKFQLKITNGPLSGTKRRKKSLKGGGPLPAVVEFLINVTFLIRSVPSRRLYFSSSLIPI